MHAAELLRLPGPAQNNGLRLNDAVKLIKELLCSPEAASCQGNRFHRVLLFLRSAVNTDDPFFSFYTFRFPKSIHFGSESQRTDFFRNGSGRNDHLANIVYHC